MERKEAHADHQQKNPYKLTRYKKAAQNHIEELQKDECSHHQAAEMHWLYRKKRQKALPDIPGRATAKMLLHFHHGQ